ncbi:MAG: hypothetical protein PHU12_04200 [Candidatus Aenigmarchaeota archaeon]|nr:hypothetical protein [Candidatus Aenigmarchaeota archaeon]
MIPKTIPEVIDGLYSEMIKEDGGNVMVLESADVSVVSMNNELWYVCPPKAFFEMQYKIREQRQKYPQYVVGIPFRNISKATTC